MIFNVRPFRIGVDYIKEKTNIILYELSIYERRSDPTRENLLGRGRSLSKPNLITS